MSDRSSSPDVALAADLVHRIHGGDRQAEALFVEHFSRGISFFLRHHAPSWELADDLHQETFRIALERLRQRTLDDPGRLGGFLVGVARNLLRNEGRRRMRSAVDDQEFALEKAPDLAADPLRALIDDEDARHVRQLVNELGNARDRQVLYRFYIAEDAKERICSDLGLAESHLRRVLFRARQRLKTLLVRSAQQGPTPIVSQAAADIACHQESHHGP